VSGATMSAVPDGTVAPEPLVACLA
jgi:hypothetical protein